jgi:hypothetical protein
MGREVGTLLDEEPAATPFIELTMVICNGALEVDPFPAA